MFKDFIQLLKERGFIFQQTNEEHLSSLVQKEKITAYIGFDCTAPSLHVGSLVQIMMLRHLQKFGHKPIVLMGGGTTKIGDPTGKDQMRKMLTPDQIQENMDGIQKCFAPFIKFGSNSSDAILLNNSEWLENLKYIDFLEMIGRHFSINRMLTFESVKQRLDREQNLTFLEFNYMILQAYDFCELNKKYNCMLQMGGSDQWGNIVSGIELTRRMHNKEVFGLTSPLITTASGQKMGKSEGNAVWLRPEMYSPYDYWQFWRNTEDADVVRFLKLFTELPLDEISRLAKLEGSEINEAKKILATEATALCHGRENAISAAETARLAFEEKSFDADLPEFNASKSALASGINLYNLLKDSGLCTSSGESRRLIRGKGARINDKVIEDENYIISINDLLDNESLKLSSGKKKHILVKFN